MRLPYILCVILLGAPAFGASEAPYAGQDGREIASLSETDVADLLAGKGWGLAKPAELNGYPGPTHVLELAGDLDLTPEQRSKIEALFAEMQAEAMALGADYVAAEAHLSRLFRSGHANGELLEQMLTESAQTLAMLRAVHLKAHLATTPILTDAQRTLYANLRGYGADTGHAGHTGEASH